MFDPHTLTLTVPYGRTLLAPLSELGMAGDANEQSPLLSRSREDEDPRQLIDFGEGDPENSRNWKRSKKLINVGVIALMAGLLQFSLKGYRMYSKNGTNNT